MFMFFFFWKRGKQKQGVGGRFEKKKKKDGKKGVCPSILMYNLIMYNLIIKVFVCVFRLLARTSCFNIMKTDVRPSPPCAEHHVVYRITVVLGVINKNTIWRGKGTHTMRLPLTVAPPPPERRSHAM